MKNKLLFILGTLLWIFIFTGLAAGSYINAQGVYKTKQQGLQGQVQNLKQQVQAAKVSLSSRTANTRKACAEVATVQTELARYKVSIVLPTPNECR